MVATTTTGRWSSVTAVATVVVLAMVASVAMPSVVFADEERTEIDGLEALRTANDAFDEEDFETAYDYYEKAYGILEEPLIKYRMGQTAEKLEWAEEAVDHYEHYREIGDDEEFLSRIDESMPELREQLLATVEVLTEPEGATVTAVEPSDAFDDTETPATLELEAGELEVAISLDNYTEKTVQKTLEAGADHVLDVTLEQKDEPEEVAEIEEPEELAEIEEPEELGEPDEEEPAALADFDDVDDVDESSVSLTTWGWATTGAGLSMLAFGGAMTFMQQSATDEVNELNRAEAGQQTESFEERQQLREEQQDLRDDARTYYRLSTAGYIAGGVFTAAGAGLLIYDMLGTGEAGDEGLSLQGSVGARGGTIGFGGRF